MGVVLGMFTKEEKANKAEMNRILRSSIVEWNNAEKVVDLGKTVRFLTNADDEIITTPLSRETSARSKGRLQLKKILKMNPPSQPNYFGKRRPVNWNFEDEFKFYVQESNKRKLRSSDVSQAANKPKLDRTQSTLAYHSLDQDSLTNKLKIVSIDLRSRFSDDISTAVNVGKLFLKKLPSPVISSFAPEKVNESLNIENNSRIRINNRACISGTEKDTKVQNLKLVEDHQLTCEPRVILDSSIVTKYLKAKRIIHEILRIE